jgi:hypothetical protein
MPVFLPPLPYLSESHELNFSTYVHLDGMPGVWFFSLDANNPVAAWGHGRPSPEGDPLLHQQGEPLFVSVWPPARVR